MSSDDNLLVLDTHYGVVRYLYNEVFRKRHNQLDDLQNQVLFLNSVNKYLLCRTGQYAHLYNMYTSLDGERIREYYEVNRIKMNITKNEWLNYTNLVASPRILPQSVDGPYMIDNVSLRRYTYFWTSKYRFTSNILATPYFCLDGVDHLYYEMIKWKSDCEHLGVELLVRSKHIFHETFYIVEVRGKSEQMHIRFLVWLDEVDVQTELYIIPNERLDETEEDAEGGGASTNVCLLKRLYIACDNNAFVLELSMPDKKQPLLHILDMFVNRLSSHFVVTFDGRPPKITTTAPLHITNMERNAPAGTAAMMPLNFGEISHFGYQAERVDQIYEIERLSELNVSQIETPNVLVFQEEFSVSYQPLVAEMNKRMQEFLQLLSMGMLDRSVYVRMYMLPQNVDLLPHAMKKQLSVLYMQKYRKFSISRESIEYNPTFYDKTYVFAARNLVCTVKSIKYLIRDVIKSTPLLPPCAMLMPMNHIDEQSAWHRITQNIIYLQSTRSVLFVNNFTLQALEERSNSSQYYEDNCINVKSISITNENTMRDELNRVFTYTDMNVFDMKTITTFDDIDLKCLTVNRNLNFELYYFAYNVKHENSNTTTAATTDNANFRNFFTRFMHANETRQQLNDKIYIVFMHMYNLFNNNILL